MNCSNNNCNKKGISSYSCLKCAKAYCGKKCLTEHFDSTHENTSHSSDKYLLEVKHLLTSNDSQFGSLNSFEFIKNKEGNPQSIGNGSFSEVYLAKSRIDQKLYAIKHIQKAKVKSTGQSLDIVQREISLHRLFHHNNIIRLYGSIEEEEGYYMIMEYANSGSLFQLIRRQGGFEEKEAFSYFIQSACALNYLHEHGYAHRDVKPENILFTDDKTVKLSDFGLCVNTSKGNRETFCGTIEYMAPEIIQEIPYDKSIDVWSLGVLLYELLHGYSPFRAKVAKGKESHQEVFQSIMKQKYAIEKKISADCVDLIAKLLTADSAKRIEVRDIFNHPWVVALKGKESNCSCLLFDENPFTHEPHEKPKRTGLKTRVEVNDKPSRDMKMPIKIKNIPDSNFCLFEDNVFEDTLKMIDSKMKRKVKNNVDYNDIRVCSTTKQFEPSFTVKQKEKRVSSNSLQTKSFQNEIQSGSKEGKAWDKGGDMAINSSKPNQSNLNKEMQIDIDTPTPFEEVTEPNKGIIKDQSNKEHKEENKDKLLNAIGLIENAYDHDNADLKKAKANQPEESFWDKFFTPFKCGSNN